MPGRRYFVEMGASLAAYALLLVISLLMLRHHAAAPPWQTAVALAPMLPGGAMCWAVIRQLGRMDELQRRIQYEALAIAFAATALITFSYGFLETIGYQKMSMFSVWPVMAICWIAGLFISRWRYA